MPVGVRVELTALQDASPRPAPEQKAALALHQSLRGGLWSAQGMANIPLRVNKSREERDRHMISGSIVALVTPMLTNGELDWQALQRLVTFHLEQGTDGILVSGTTGESATLTVTEQAQLTERVLQLVDGRVPVIVGCSSSATRDAVHLAAQARSLGADACLVAAPAYNKPTQEGLYQHFLAISRAVPLPLILYNVPGRTAVDILPETVEKLADLDTVIAIKEASDLERGKQLVQRVGSRMAVLSGDDPTAVDLMLEGGSGVISVTANVAPAQMHRLCALAREGKAEQAHSLNAQLMPLHAALFTQSNPIPVKHALHHMQLTDKGIRLPLTPLSTHLQAPLEEALAVAAALPVPETRHSTLS